MSTRAAALTAGTAPTDTRVGRADAATVLAVLLACLLFIPSRYALVQVAGFVTPAFLVGLFAAFWWVHARLVPGLGAARGRQPVRLAALLLLWTSAASCCGLLVRLHNAAETRAVEAGLLVLVSMVGIALLAADGIHSRARLDWLLRLAVIGTAVVAVIALLQFFFAIDIAAHLRPPGLSVLSGSAGFILSRVGGIRQAAGTASHPIEMGVVLALMLPLAIHYSRFPGRRGPLVYQVASVLITFAMFVTVSRSTFVAVGVAALVLLPTWPRRLRLGALAAVPVAAVAVRVAAPGVVGTLIGLFVHASTDNSFLHRVDDYSRAAAYVVDAPLFGRGIHTFIPTQYFYIDNSYLLALLETGVIGALAIVALFAIGIGVARGARRRSDGVEARDLGQTLAASIAAAMATTFTYDSFSFPMATGITFLLIGCAGALWRLQGGGRRSEELQDAEVARA